MYGTALVPSSYLAPVNPVITALSSVVARSGPVSSPAARARRDRSRLLLLGACSGGSLQALDHGFSVCVPPIASKATHSLLVSQRPDRTYQRGFGSSRLFFVVFRAGVCVGASFLWTGAAAVGSLQYSYSLATASATQLVYHPRVEALAQGQRPVGSGLHINLRRKESRKWCGRFKKPGAAAALPPLDWHRGFAPCSTSRGSGGLEPYCERQSGIGACFRASLSGTAPSHPGL